jgi:hypothetical protein
MLQESGSAVAAKVKSERREGEPRFLLQENQAFCLIETAGSHPVKIQTAGKRRRIERHCI